MEEKTTRPLRKVVGHNESEDVSQTPGLPMVVPRWKLECGHLVSPPQDIYGERFPERMRCRACAALQAAQTQFNSEGDEI